MVIIAKRCVGVFITNRSSRRNVEPNNTDGGAAGDPADNGISPK